MDWSGSGHGQVAGSPECRDGHWGSIKRGELLDCVIPGQPLKRDHTAWSELVMWQSHPLPLHHHFLQRTFTLRIQRNSLTPRCRVLPEQLTGLQLVKKFPAFHGTRRFITALTSIRHLFLSWASTIQSICPHPTSCRSVPILVWNKTYCETNFVHQVG